MDHFETVEAFMADTLTINETAVHFGVTRLTVTRWIKSGKLEARKICGEWRIKKETIKGFHR